MIIPAKGHTLTAHAKVEPTCTEPGTEAYWECSVCHRLFSDENAATEIEAPAAIPGSHHLTAHSRIEAVSCTEPGTEAYWECSVCGKLYADENAATEIPEPVSIPAGHLWGAPEYSLSSDKRFMTARCVCERDKNHVLEATAPVESAGISPTEDTAGYASFSAEFVNEFFEPYTFRFNIPALKDLDVLRLPSSLKAIEAETFAGLACQAVILPESCEAVASNAFRGCPDLICVLVSSGSTVLEEDAFAGCENLLLISRLAVP